MKRNILAYQIETYPIQLHLPEMVKSVLSNPHLQCMANVTIITKFQWTGGPGFSNRFLFCWGFVPLTILLTILWTIVALGTTTIDSTPTIGVRWRRVLIQPAEYLRQWESFKLVPTGFQNSGPLFRITKAWTLSTRTPKKTVAKTHRGHREDGKKLESRPLWGTDD